MAIFNVKTKSRFSNIIYEYLDSIAASSPDLREKILAELGSIESDTILSRTFYEWKSVFAYRRRITNHATIDVSQDPDCVFIETQFIENIKSSTSAEYIVAKFGCDDAPTYQNLTLYFCGMDKSSPDVKPPIYKASLKKGDSATQATLEDMKRAITNFRNRNRILASTGFPYHSEIEGVAHKIGSILDFAQLNKITEFAVHFGIDLRNGTTIMLIDSAKDITKGLSGVDDDDVFDHGTGCCPIP